MIQKLGRAKVPCGAFLVFHGEKPVSFRCAKPHGHLSRHKTLAPVTYPLPTGLWVWIEHGVEWQETAQ